MSNQHSCTRRKPFSLAEQGNTLKHFSCLFRVMTLRQQRPTASELCKAHSSGRPCFSPCSKYTWVPKTLSAPLWVFSVTFLGPLQRRTSSVCCLIPGLFSLPPSSYLDPLDRLCTLFSPISTAMFILFLCSSEAFYPFFFSPRWQMHLSKTKFRLNKGQTCDVCQKEFAEPKFCSLNGDMMHLDCAGS